MANSALTAKCTWRSGAEDGGGEEEALARPNPNESALAAKLASTANQKMPSWRSPPENIHFFPTLISPTVNSGCKMAL